MKMSNEILIVEDDLLLGDTLKDFFECNGLSVHWTKDGEAGLKYYTENHPDLILLDVILPGINGLEVIAEIRKTNTIIPIILMTGTEFDEKSQIKGYQLGAVNYLKKPILPQVILAQILNLIQPTTVNKYSFKNLEISINNQLLSINNVEIQLREKEEQLLVFFLNNCNRIQSRNDILFCLWKENLPNRNNQLDSLISRLKKTLKPFHEISIKKIYGMGYGLFVEE